MGLRVGGFGILPQTVIDGLTPREEGLASILNLPTQPITIPKGKTDLQKLAAELDRQIQVLGDFIHTASPEAKVELLPILRVAREARLDIEGRLVSWAAVTAERRSADEPKFSSAEAAATFAMFGASFSPGVMTHAMKMLDAHLAPEDRKANVDELDAATGLLADKASGRVSKNNRPVLAAVAVPILGGLALARAASIFLSFEPAVGMALNATAIQLGLHIGRTRGTQASLNAGFQFGVPRLSGEADHDLALMFDRATGLSTSLWRKTDAEAKPIVEKQVALLRMLTARRRETWPGRGQIDPLEQRAVQKFERLADLLQQGGVEAARSRVSGLDFSRADLLKVPSLPDLDRAAHPLDVDQTMQSFRAAISEAAKSCLAVTNPSLRRLVEDLESRHLATGTQLSDAERETLHRFVGESPSIAEVLALSRLARSGSLQFAELWPKGELRGVDGRALEPADAKLLFETLGSRATGSRIDSLGRVLRLIAPFLGSIAAFFTAQGLGAPDMGSVIGYLQLFGTIGAAIAANLSGTYLGLYVSKKGVDRKLSSGLEPAMAIGREYAVELPRLLNPRDLLKGTVAEVKAGLRLEADVLGVMLSSIDHTRQKLNEAVDRLKLNELGLSPEESQLKEILEKNLTELNGRQEVHYSTLAEVQKELVLIADKGSIGEMRSAFAKARLEMYGLMPVTWGEIVASQTQPELSKEVEVYYQVKQRLIDNLKNWEPGDLMTADLARSAEIVVNGHKELPKSKRPAKDDLDKLAAQLMAAKTKGSEVDPQLLLRVLRPEFGAELRAKRLEASPISNERAGEIAQEALNAYWSQLLPMYGLVPDALAQKPPKLEDLRVTRIAGKDDRTLPTFRVEARIAGGGKLSIPVDAAGILDANFGSLQMDLGPRLLERLAIEATKDHFAALTGTTADGAKATLVSRNDAGVCTFAVGVGDSRFKTQIGPRGELDATAIQAS